MGTRRRSSEKHEGLGACSEPSRRTSHPEHPEAGHALVEQAILLASVVGLLALSTVPMARELLESLAEHLDWIRFVVEAPFP